MSITPGGAFYFERALHRGAGSKYLSAMRFVCARCGVEFTAGGGIFCNICRRPVCGAHVAKDPDGTVLLPLRCEDCAAKTSH